MKVMAPTLPGAKLTKGGPLSTTPGYESGPAIPNQGRSASPKVACGSPWVGVGLAHARVLLQTVESLVRTVLSANLAAHIEVAHAKRTVQLLASVLHWIGKPAAEQTCRTAK
jgi:hypothetical protein